MIERIVPSALMNTMSSEEIVFFIHICDSCGRAPVEQHAAVGRDGRAEHQADLLLLGRQCHLDVEVVALAVFGDDDEFFGRQRRLRPVDRLAHLGEAGCGALRQKAGGEQQQMAAVHASRVSIMARSASRRIASRTALAGARRAAW